MESKIRLVLVGAPDEPTINDPDYQKQLGEFYRRLQEAGIEASPRIYVRDSYPEGVVGFHTVTYPGEFAIPLAKWGGSAIAGALVAWLKMRSQRKVRVEFHPSGRLKRSRHKRPRRSGR
jgi:hypothetical protein